MKIIFKIILLELILLPLNSVFCQNFNKSVIINDEEILLGKCDKTAFSKNVFGTSYQFDYNSYIPDSTTIVKLSTNKNYSIVIVLGSWCSDSREQLPKFMKIADILGLSEIEMICVDRNKTIEGSEGLINNLKIDFVPTFIIYAENKELGRIVETPEESLEKDLLKILENK